MKIFKKLNIKIYILLLCFFSITNANGQSRVQQSGFYPEDSIVYFSTPVEKKIKTWICINCDYSNEEKLWKTYDGTAIPLYNRTKQPNDWADGPFVKNPPNWLTSWLALKPNAKRQNLDKVNVVRIKTISNKDTTEQIYHIGVGIQQPKGTVTFFDYETLADMVGPDGHYGPGRGFHDTTIVHLPDQTLVLPKFQENNYLVNASDKRSFYERPITLTIYNSDFDIAVQEKVVVGLSAGTSIHLPNKGFQITARKELTGKNRIPLPIYNTDESFKNIRFRAGGTSQLNRDHPCSFLNDPLSLDITSYARNEYNTLFVNGVFWTIDFIQEKTDEHWVERRYGFNSKDVDIIELDNKSGVKCAPQAAQLAALDSVVDKSEMDIFSQVAYTPDYCECGSVKDGNGRAFGKFAQKIQQNKLEDIDLQSLWDYLVYVRFLQNTDMGINNTFMFCDDRNHPTWYVFGNDFDQAFYGSATEKKQEWLKLMHSNKRDLFSRITRMALSSQENKNDFFRRAQDLLNTTLLPERTTSFAAQRVSELNAGIEQQFYSWMPNIHGTAKEWLNQCGGNQMETYLNAKPNLLKNTLASDFYPSQNWISEDQNKVTIILENVPPVSNGKVSVDVNSLRIEHTWSGCYFPEPTVKIQLNLPKGLELIEWEGLNHSDLVFELNPTKPIELKPIIQQTKEYTKNVNQLKISEIYAAGERDQFDWIELYNGTNDTIDLSGLFLTDDVNKSTKFEIPLNKNSLLAPNSYQIFYCSGLVKFGWDHTNFKLNSTEGEAIYLINSTGGIIDGFIFPSITNNVSYGYCNGKYQTMKKPTLGESNKCK